MRSYLIPTVVTLFQGLKKAKFFEGSAIFFCRLCNFCWTTTLTSTRRTSTVEPLAKSACSCTSPRFLTCFHTFQNLTNDLNNSSNMTELIITVTPFSRRRFKKARPFYIEIFFDSKWSDQLVSFPKLTSNIHLKVWH